jgi:hypothetical protein
LSTAETPGRIRWEPVTSTTIAVETGHVGLLPSHSFVIYSPEAGRTGLTVTSQLPGQQHHRYTGDRVGELKEVAEHWLEDHVAALGACFRGPSCEHCGSELHRDEKDSCWLGADESDCCAGAVYHQPEGEDRP